MSTFPFFDSAFGLFLADTLDRVTPGMIGWAVIGLISALTVVALVLTVLNQGKRFFGRQPSLNQVLAGLVSVVAWDDYKQEQHLRHRGLEEQISKVRHDTDERFNADLVRVEKVFGEIFKRSEERDRAIDNLAHVVSRLQERTETHVRNFDSLFTKIDNLLRDVNLARRAGK
jgi:hypothetical protein